MSEDDTSRMTKRRRAESTARRECSTTLDRLGELEKELEEVRQHVLYAQAETQNVRRRLEQEKVSAAAYAATGFARDMLSVKDNLERALDAIPEELREDEQDEGPRRRASRRRAASWTGPFQATASPRRGDGPAARPAFPPGDARNAGRRAEPGTIVQEMQAGYTIKDRLLRPALVGVAKAG